MSRNGSFGNEVDILNDNLHGANISNNVGLQIDNGDGSDTEAEIAEDMDPKQRLALTLMNWASIPENDHHMLQVPLMFSIAFNHFCLNNWI